MLGKCALWQLRPATAVLGEEEGTQGRGIIAGREGRRKIWDRRFGGIIG
jgi:hypothetical protein